MEDIEIFRKRLFYQSQHRGTKEMDLILKEFVEKKLRSMTYNELKDFESLLSFSDHELQKYLIRNLSI